MSVRRADECLCSCHRTGAVHAFPCCDGECYICHRYIRRGAMKQHKEDHDAELASLLRPVDETGKP